SGARNVTGANGWTGQPPRPRVSGFGGTTGWAFCAGKERRWSIPLTEAAYSASRRSTTALVVKKPGGVTRWNRRRPERYSPSPFSSCGAQCPTDSPKRLCHGDVKSTGGSRRHCGALNGPLNKSPSEPCEASRGDGRDTGGVPFIERVASREIYRNPWLVLREDDIRRPDGSHGSTPWWTSRPTRW